MRRSPISLVLAVFALALVAVPAAFASGRDHHAVRSQGVCTQRSTSTLKLGREDRGIEVEFQVDQNQNRVPWTVKLSRNGTTVASLIATTRAPSGSFEIRRVVAGRLGTDRITAIATRASGETCTAGGSAHNARTAPVGDDHGRHAGGHA